MFLFRKLVIGFPFLAVPFVGVFWVVECFLPWCANNQPCLWRCAWRGFLQRKTLRLCFWHFGVLSYLLLLPVFGFVPCDFWYQVLPFWAVFLWPFYPAIIGGFCSGVPSNWYSGGSQSHPTAALLCQQCLQQADCCNLEGPFRCFQQPLKDLKDLLFTIDAK